MARTPWPRTSATIVHGSLTLGCTLLALGFLTLHPILFQLALPCLAGGFLWLLAACSAGIWRVHPSNPTLTAIRCSLVGLAITVALGAADH